MSSDDAVQARLARAMATVKAVGKDGKNREQGYTFRSIDAFLGAANRALASEGIAVTPRVLTRLADDSHATRGGAVLRWIDLEVETTFHAPDGTSVSTVTWGEGRDAADKATNKAMTAAVKYALMYTLMVPTSDIDEADASSPETVAPAARQRADAAQADVERLWRAVEQAVAVVEDLNARGEALRALWQEAQELGGLGCVVPVPADWRTEGGPTAVTLDQLIMHARTLVLNKEEEK